MDLSCVERDSSFLLVRVQYSTVCKGGKVFRMQKGYSRKKTGGSIALLSSLRHKMKKAPQRTFALLSQKQSVILRWRALAPLGMAGRNNLSPSPCVERLA